MIDVEIRNFQAIDDLKLEIEGFTALVGRTNIGKSSIVRALKTALAGGSGSDFVRHDARACGRILTGAKSCKCCSSVKVMFGEGQGFLWEKGGKVNRYTVWKDGQEAIYDRVGQSMDLPEVLGAQFAPVKLGPKDSLLQVTTQFEAPFLLDLSGGAVADVLSDIGQLDDINQAMAAVSKDRRSAIATRKVRESDVKALGEQLDAYSTLDSHLARVDAVRKQGAHVTTASQRLALLDRLIAEVTNVSRDTKRLKAALEPALPEASPTRAAADRHTRAHTLQEALVRQGGAVGALERALQPQLPNARSLADAAERWRKVCGWLLAVGERERAAERLVKVGRLPVPTPAWAEAQERLRQVSGWLATLGTLKVTFEKAAKLQKLTVPEVGSVSTLAKRAAEATRLLTALDRLERDVESTEQELDAACRELQSTQAEFRRLGVCPTCHQDISPEHVVACAAG